MGCPEFAVPSLCSLFSDESFKIVAVYSMPDRPKGRGQQFSETPVKMHAGKYQLPIRTPTSFSKSPDEIEELKSMLPDFLVVIAYGLILPQEVLNIPRIASVNIHASLLPKYRGPAPIQFSLINGDSETGITAMQMNSKMDTGDILAQETVKIKPDDCFKTLHDRLSEKSPTLLVSTLKKMAQGVISPRPQIHAEATYTTKITSTLAQINWKQNASKLVYLIRAMYPSPGAWFDFDGDRIKVGAAIEGSATTAIPGSRLACDPKQGIQIACGENSSIFLLLLQRPGKAMMPASEFLKGYSKLISSENFAS